MLSHSEKFWYLNVPMGVHLGDGNYRWGDIYRRMTNYMTGLGQVLRLDFAQATAVTSELRAIYLALRGLFTELIEATALVMFLISGSPLLPFSLGSLGVGVLAYKAAKRRFLRAALVFARNLHIESPWLLKGFLRSPRDPSTSPGEVRWITS